MGATKRAMELSIMRRDNTIPVTGARFANVAFSNGSLLESFQRRVTQKQPLSTPSDIRRFFITPQEAGIICLFSAILGKNNTIFFPCNEKEMKLTSFLEIAQNFLLSIGKKAVLCYDEIEARDLIQTLDLNKYWPINVFVTDTVGEKPFEEFYTDKESIQYGDYKDLACIEFTSDKSQLEVSEFLAKIEKLDLSSKAAVSNMLELFKEFVPTFDHVDSKRHLNARM
jgi:FlaA1/EpsC-like NDP-sugar epimerase